MPRETEPEAGRSLQALLSGGPEWTKLPCPLPGEMRSQGTRGSPQPARVTNGAGKLCLVR